MKAEPKSKPCKFLDTGKSKILSGYPELKCRAYSPTSCPKKEGKKCLNAMCHRMGERTKS